MRRVGDGEGNVVTSADAGCFMDLIYRARCHEPRRDRFDPLIFFYFRWSLFFFTEPRCGIARNRKRRAGSRLDDR